MKKEDQPEGTHRFTFEYNSWSAFQQWDVFYNYKPFPLTEEEKNYRGPMGMRKSNPSGGPLIAIFERETDAIEYCDFKNKQLEQNELKTN